ncbi:MAG: NAD(P)H-hydrate dehydratase [Gammaproteobacteria bacterium]|nr:NAD(P)H-hydrate dehydratase [Gammaproteobacteria bacterium]
MVEVATTLPRLLYRAAGVRALDRAAIDGAGVAGATLMARAGAAAWQVLRTRWPQARRVLVYCGTGNNGGDGYVLARLAREDGAEVEVVQVGDAGRFGDDAREHAADAQAAGVRVVSGASVAPRSVDVIVDALLGIGLERPLEGEWREAVEAINGAGRPVLAMDVPTGIDADTGRVHGVAVRAHATVTFMAAKPGLLTGAAVDYCGQIWFADLGVPRSVYAAAAPDAELIAMPAEARILAPRVRSGHKGNYGHVLVIGGTVGYAGAARMAAEAAARVGAGLVSLATRAEHASYVTLLRPEIMTHAAETRAALAPLLERASVIAVGPGLGRGPWGVDMLRAALAVDRPVVLDADALSMIAVEPVHSERWVLTPHPAEAARLLGTSTAAIQADRYAAARLIHERYGGVCVLKGAGTVVAAAQVIPAVCAHGNPGMASGGMGDVLTGVIAGLMAQGLTSLRAARLGVCLHAAAGDAAAVAGGTRGLLATDLFAHLRRLANPD